MTNHRTFRQQYDERIEKVGNHLCVGLDTDWSALPEGFDRTPDSMLQFNEAIIEQTVDIALAYKLNFAFYEAAGPAGVEVMRKTVEMLPDDVVIIADAKRGDIGNTARAYAEGIMRYGFDAVTVNPYMGVETMAPYFEYPGRCVFALALTSNPGARDFEHLNAEGKPLYLHVIDRCLEEYRDADSLGFVVGATRPKELRDVRSHVGFDVPLLIPGVGSQGGSAEEVLNANRGGVAFVNVSRGISRASMGHDFKERAGEKARMFAEQLASINVQREIDH